MNTVIGIDIGGTQVKFGRFCRDSGERLEEAVHPTRDGETLAGQPAWLETIRRQLEAWSPGKDSPVGLAAPGLADPDGRAIAHMPGRLEGLEGLDWTRQLDWPTPVRVLNDAQAALLGECWAGSARGSRNVLLLTLGTGVGGAALVDGRILRGHIGRAGHFGHLSLDPEGEPDITGTPGSLEDIIGEASLQSRSGGRFATTREMLEARAAGDPDAAAVWERSLRGLGAAMASLINAFDPEIFLLTGGVSQAGEALLEPLKARLAEIEWRPGGHAVPIRTGTLLDWAGACGAASQNVETK